MFEQKKTKQIEQNLAPLQIQSGELGLGHPDNRDELIAFVQNDTRSQAEIFESLKNRIKRDANGQLDESQAIEATRNLLRFFETLLAQNHKNQLNIVDKQRVHGNVTIKEK